MLLYRHDVTACWEMATESADSQSEKQARAGRIQEALETPSQENFWWTFLHEHTKTITPSNGGLTWTWSIPYMVRHIPSMFRNYTCSPAILRTPHPFSGIPHSCTCLSPTNTLRLLISPTQGEGAFWAWAHLSPFLEQRIQFQLCFAEHSFLLLVWVTTGLKDHSLDHWPVRVR